MNKAEIYNYLNEHGISYECTEHPAVYNMEELDALELPYPEWDAKNLFVRDDKKKNFYLITVRGEKRVDLKEFRTAQPFLCVSRGFTCHLTADTRFGLAVRSFE